MTGAPACAPDGDGFSLRALRMAASEWLRSNNLSEPQHSRNIDNQQQHNNQHDSSRENEAIHDTSPSATCYTFIGGVAQHASAKLGLDGVAIYDNIHTSTYEQNAMGVCATGPAAPMTNMMAREHSNEQEARSNTSPLCYTSCIGSKAQHASTMLSLDKPRRRGSTNDNCEHDGRARSHGTSDERGRDERARGHGVTNERGRDGRAHDGAADERARGARARGDATDQ